MDQIASVTKVLDKKAKGNTGILNSIYKTAMNAIRRSCKSDEEFEKKCGEFLDSACACMGEEYREFYKQYMLEMKSEQ